MRSAFKKQGILVSMHKGMEEIDAYLGPGNWNEKWFIAVEPENGMKYVHLVLDNESDADDAMDFISNGSGWQKTRRLSKPC